MKKTIIILLLSLIGYGAVAQTQYNLNYDTIRVGKANNSSGIGLYGDIHIKKGVIAEGTLGTELVTNGTFTTDLTGWTGTNWSYSSGTALHAAGSEATFVQAGTLATIGDTYKVSYKITGRTAGNVKVYFGGVWGGGGTGDVNTTHVNYLTATASDSLYFEPTSDFDGALDSISIKKLTTTGNSIFETPAFFRKTLTVHNRIDFAEGLPITIGLNALKNTTTGQYNIAASNLAIGFNAGRNTTTGHATVAGYYAGYENTDGVITAFGKWAGLNNTEGHASFFGNAAGRSNTTGEGSYFGDESGSANQTGNVSVFGYYAGNQALNVDVAAFGHQAARYGVSADGVSAFGTSALEKNLTSYNSAFGHQASFENLTGVTSSFGYRAGYNNTSGTISAFGREALISNTTGIASAFGDRAGYSNTSGNISAFGHEALRSSSTGYGSALGYHAGYSTTTGSPVLFGYQAGLRNTTGNLIAIGNLAGEGTNLSNAPLTDSAAILIGHNSNRSVPSATRLTNYVGIGDGVLIDKSNQVKIGNDDITETILQGNVIAETGEFSGVLDITSVTIGDNPVIFGFAGDTYFRPNLATKGIKFQSFTGSNIFAVDGSGNATLPGLLTATNASLNTIKITDLAGNGKVLTSDASGNASWQSPASGFISKGAWDASTNTPTLADGVGTNGDTYYVSAGGTQFGRIFVTAGLAIYNGSIWQPVGSAGGVASVNSLTGAVQINPGLSGNTLSVTGGTATVDIGAATDVAANTAARHSAVTIGTANGLSLSTQTLSLAAANGSTTGALTATDWNTFNNKQSGLSGTGIVKSTSGAITYLTDNSATWNKVDAGSTLTNSISGTAAKATVLQTTGSGADGRISYDSAFGLTSRGVAGSVKDYTVFNPAGSIIMSNPTGTLDMGFSGNVTASNLSGTNTGDQTWSTLSGKPTFSTVATTGAYSDLTGTPSLSGYQTVANLQTDLTASASKYPSVNAVNTGLALKENTITAGTTTQYYRGDKSWQTLDKTAVGLSNVDNTPDASKPVSTATQTALDLKAPLVSPAFTGTPTAPTPTAGDNSTKVATTAYVQANAGKQLKEWYTDASNSSTTETDLYTYSVPGNTLVNNGDKLKFTISGNFSITANNKTIKIYFGGSTFAFTAVTSSGGSWVVDGTIIKTSATDYRITLNKTETIAAASIFSSSGIVTNYTAANTFKITGTGGASNDIFATMGTLEFKPAAP